MPASSVSRVISARTKGIEVIAATQIRRPCNSFFKSGPVAQEEERSGRIPEVALESPDLRCSKGEFIYE